MSLNIFSFFIHNLFSYILFYSLVLLMVDPHPKHFVPRGISKLEKPVPGPVEMLTQQRRTESWNLFTFSFSVIFLTLLLFLLLEELSAGNTSSLMVFLSVVVWLLMTMFNVSLPSCPNEDWNEVKTLQQLYICCWKLCHSLLKRSNFHSSIKWVNWNW